MGVIRVVDDYYYKRYVDRVVILDSKKYGSVAFLMDDDSFDIMDNSMSHTPLMDVLSDAAKEVGGLINDVAGSALKKIPGSGVVSDVVGNATKAVGKAKDIHKSVTGSDKFSKYQSIKKITSTDGMNSFSFNFTITKNLKKVTTMFNEMTISSEEAGILKVPYLDIGSSTNSILSGLGNSIMSGTINPVKIGEAIVSEFSSNLCTVQIGNWLYLDNLIPTKASVSIRTDAFDMEGAPILGTGRVVLETLYEPTLSETSSWLSKLNNTDYTFKFNHGDT